MHIGLIYLSIFPNAKVLQITTDHTPSQLGAQGCNFIQYFTKLLHCIPHYGYAYKESLVCTISSMISMQLGINRAYV